MKLEQLLEEFGRKKGLGKLEFDALGISRVMVNNTSMVSFEKSLDGQGFYLYAVVGLIPLDREKELFLMALEGNLFGKETGSANLGYHSKYRGLILFEYLEEGTVDFPFFERKFEEFVQHLTYWMNKIESKETPKLEDLSLEKHTLDIKERKNIIFFA